MIGLGSDWVCEFRIYAPNKNGDTQDVCPSVSPLDSE